ncbi:hypothetical protein D3C81_1805920 [compost metagenome]
MKAKGSSLRLTEGMPIGPSGLKQAVGADNIGLDKVRRAIDGAIDMGFGSQVHDRVRLEPCQHCADGGLIADVGLHELIASVGGNAAQRLQIAGVGQLVQVEHFMFGVPDQMANQRRTDKAGTAGDENAHGEGLFPYDV